MGLLPHLLTKRRRADALFEAGQNSQAITAYRELLSEKPELPDTWFNLAVALRRTGQFEAALAAYDAALNHGISGPEDVYLNRAVIFLEGLRDDQAAEAALRKVLERVPEHAAALMNLAGLYEDRGDRVAAVSGYQKLLSLYPDNVEALSRLANLSTIENASDPLIARLEQARDNSSLPPMQRAMLGHALARLLDRCGAFEAAFAACVSANAENRAAGGNRPSDPAAFMRRVEATKAAYPEVHHRRATQPSPIFILGMMRSGSTLIEQVLASHRDVSSGGELDLIPRLAAQIGSVPGALATGGGAAIEQMAEAYARQTEPIRSGGTCLTDKRPDNFWHVGLIKRLFPDAKIIHTRRNPLDNCLSVFFLHLDPSQAYAMELADTARYLLAERAMMAHWKQLWPDDILTVDYEQVAEDLPGEVDRLLTFLGLAEDPACLQFHKSSSIVRTASVWQVREPIHSRSVERWRNYAPQLQGLADMFAREGLDR